jgi:iron complex transport system ATP-binding protein
MRDGQITVQGAPAEVITTATMWDVFGMNATIMTDPVSHTPTVIPIGRHHCS